MTPLSLGYDHPVISGANAARLLVPISRRAQALQFDHS
jgi:pyruvate/2-oxoglutarate dehydrogenase complex dihydrolipoamide acyltransferase (E2) component